MDLITCIECGRPVAQALDPGAKVKATCSACQPDPAIMLRFALAVREARKLSGEKVAYCAARVGVTRQHWMRWEKADQLEPPYERKDKLLTLFANTQGAGVILEEVRLWPG